MTTGVEAKTVGTGGAHSDSIPRAETPNKAIQHRDTQGGDGLSSR